MRTPLIAGNWKMNKTASEAADFINSVKHELEAIAGVDIAFCPTAIAIPAAATAAQGTKIGIGAQNMHWKESGAYTGELSPDMVAEFCQYVILGHSERRQYFGETDDKVNLKLHAALKHDLTPIVCVGESLEQNEAGETNEFVSNQIRAALKDVAAEELTNVVIAYEPIWAIGTGRSADAEMAGAIIHDAIRRTIGQLYDESVAQQVRIQYGGSVKPENAAEYMRQADIDGALVGGASLKPAFAELVREAATVYA